MPTFGFRMVASAVTLVTFGCLAGVDPVRATPYSDINQAAARAQVSVHRLRGNVAMLSGSGGNIGILAGPEGVLMVDAGIAVSEAKIRAALGRLSRGPIRTLVNTHWHWDHTDGNAWIRRTGATVLADRHVIRSLRSTIRVPEWEHTFTPVPPAGLPTRAIQTVEVLRLAGEQVVLRHYGLSHTDGDLSAYFRKADVLQTGDTFWNGVYPFIGDPAGGGIDGAIRAANQNLKLAGPRTIVIPGHGPAGSRADLVTFRNMLVDVRRRVAALKARGRTLVQVQADRPTAAYDRKWGGSVIDPSLFVALVYRGV